MSDFNKNTKHPITGEFKNAWWLDDYFGRHNYGVNFEGENRVYDVKEYDLETNDDPIVSFGEPVAHSDLEPQPFEDRIGYFEVGKTIEEYHPIDWAKLKLSNEVYHLKLRTKGWLNSISEEGAYLSLEDTQGSIFMTRKAIEEQLRLVVRPDETLYKKRVNGHTLTISKEEATELQEDTPKIETDDDHKKYLEEIKGLVSGDHPKGSPESDRIQLLAPIIQEYEKKNFSAKPTQEQKKTSDELFFLKVQVRNQEEQIFYLRQIATDLAFLNSKKTTLSKVQIENDLTRQLERWRNYRHT